MPGTSERLQHILERLKLIRQLQVDGSFDPVWNDRHRTAALERHLEVISEASRFLPEEIVATHPEIPWRRVRDLGNVLRLAYHRTNAFILQQICENDLGPLEAAVREMLSKMGGP